jgi:hypothetical protein
MPHPRNARLKNAFERPAQRSSQSHKPDIQSKIDEFFIWPHR